MKEDSIIDLKVLILGPKRSGKTSLAKQYLSCERSLLGEQTPGEYATSVGVNYSMKTTSMNIQGSPETVRLHVFDSGSAG